MSKKLTVYLSDRALAELDRTSIVHHDGTVERNTSGRLSAVVERYGEVIRRHAPALTYKEWCAVCDANNGSVLDDLPDTWMWVNVYDSLGIGEKWGIDTPSLIKTMRGWSYAESVAATEIVQRFWSDTSNTDNREWLTACGANIVEEGITVDGK